MSDKTISQKSVLIVCQHYWPETFRITDIAEGLAERGYNVDVLCGKPNYPTGKFFDGYGFFRKRKEVHNGVNIIRVPEIPRGNNTNLKIFLNYLSYPVFATLYLPFIVFKKYDRVIAYQLSPVYMTFPAILLSKIRRIRLYFYVTDFWPYNLFSIIDFRNKIIRSILTKMSFWHYRRADGIISVFKGVKRRMISEVRIPKNKNIYIPQAPEKIYEKEVFDKRLSNRFKNKFNIMFAGNINPAQSFDVVTKAAKIVYEKGYKDINYIIIGDGMTKKWLIEEVERLGLNKNFYFEGFKPVEDIPKYQTIADAMIFALSKSPIFEYGIPAKVNSYMASGKPLIGAIDGEGKRLVNEYSKCGICVNSGDYKGLANSIIKVRNMSEKDRKKMGNNGRTYHHKHFDREKNLTRLIEFVFNNKNIPDEEYKN